VPDLLLHDSDQVALASLLGSRPVPGSPLPDRAVLHQLGRLLRCDRVAMLWCTLDGLVLGLIDQPRGTLAHVGCLSELDDRAGRRRPPRMLTVEFRNGCENTVVLWMHRTRPFEDRDRALLRMLHPVLHRLVAERPLRRLGSSPDLTAQELRVLKLMGAGLSNAQIGEHLSVATATVRKHLEHAYRKLGVTGRLGALAALQGRDDPDLDLRAEVERFA
jgi:DNA-binding CsgD family transcriptional regulator